MEDSQEEIILRVHEFQASLQYGKLKVVTEPVTDIFYSIQVNPEHCRTLEDGTKVFTRDGIRHILKGLLLTLMIDDREDF